MKISPIDPERGDLSHLDSVHVRLRADQGMKTYGWISLITKDNISNVMRRTH